MSHSDKQVAFITGANRGIGFETALRLAEKDITVILGARDKAKGEEAAKKIQDKGFSVIPYQFDIDNLADHKKAYEYINKEFGKLDILINNAGIFIDRGTTASTVSSEVLRKTFETNFFNLISLTQTLLPLIKKAPAGRIVNLSSILGSLTEQSTPNSSVYGSQMLAYDASKTALNAFTVHLANELKNTKIKVNSAHPGWVKTDMGGSEAPLDIEEGGKTSVELALLSDNGPTGGFFHQGEKLGW